MDTRNKGHILLFLGVFFQLTICTANKLTPDVDEDADCDIYCYRTETNVTGYHANCSYRNFTDVSDICQMNTTAKITSLDLVGNLFKTVRSVCWNKFKSLQNLSLARNRIAFLEDGDFKNLARLKVLDLSLNQIRYNSIGKNVFKPLKTLRYLDLKQNLAGIWMNETYPATLKQLPELQILMIDGLNNGSLPLMPTLTELYLSGEYGRCNISSLNQSHFSGVNNTHHLYISNCSVGRVAKNTFSRLWNLASLDLARNTQLGIESFPNITYGLNITKSIKRLNLNSLYDYINYDLCSSLEADDIKYLTNTSLEMMTLEKNYIVRMSETAVTFFPQSLKYLSISDNMFMFGKYVVSMLEKGTMHNLVYFDTSKMYKTHIVDLTKSSSRKREIRKKLNTRDFNCSNKGLPQNHWGNMLTRNSIIDDFEALWNKMRKNGIGSAKRFPMYTETHDSSRSVSRLQYLDLSENLPGTIQMALELFNNTPNMTFLNVSNNYLGYPLLDEHRNYTVFETVTNIDTLDISNNRIIKLLPDMFVNLTKLNKLYLSNNRLTSVSFDMRTLKALTYLDLSSNRLEKVDEKARDSLDTLPNVTINLAYNSLRCTCKNIHFVTWLQKNADKFGIENWTETNCTFDNNTSVRIKDLNFNQFCFECSPSEYHTIILIVSLCILAFIITVSCGLIYRFKWNLRYLYYMTKFKLADGYQPIDDREYDKEVFVSYANEDRGFVRQQVVKELENDGNISLLVHDRDFRAGEFVADNIMRAITSTRRTVVILTSAYMNSKWCMYELNMARMEAADTGRNVLCVILKEDIPIKYMPVEVYDIIKNKTYIEFPTEEGHAGLFWNRLRATLSQ